MSDDKVRYERLREAAILSSDPHPGRHLSALLLVTVWESDTDPHDAKADFLGTPPEHLGAIMETVHELFHAARDLPKHPTTQGESPDDPQL